MCSGIVAGIGRFPWVTAGRPHDPNARDCITLEELAQISELPQVTIGAHTVNHTVTTSCDAHHVRREVQLDKTSLERYTGRSVSAFAYPCGQWTERDKAIIKAAGFALAATTANGFITVDTDPFLLPRLSIADGISIQEALCNIVGVWSPFINSVKSLLSSQ